MNAIENWGILTGGISNADSVTDCYVSGRVFPIQGTGNTDIDILRNVVHTDVAMWGITVGTALTGADGNIKFNVLFSDGVDGDSEEIHIFGTDSVTYDGNLCDEDHAGCADCISDGQCEPFTSPLSGN